MKLSFLMMSALLAGAMAVPAAAQRNPAAAPGNAPAQGTPAAPATEPDPLLDPMPLPDTPVSLIGGVVSKIDLIRNRMAVKVFGGKTMQFHFDGRSHIFRDGMETTQLAIRQGERVYVDSQLDRINGNVFARNIHIVTAAAEATANGQVLDYQPARGTMTLQDRLSGQALTIRVGQNTRVSDKNQPASTAVLRPGTLVSVKFAPGGVGSGVAQQVNVIAEPGATFLFAGRVSYLDLRSGTLAVDNASDHENYIVHITRDQVTPDLQLGSQVTIQTSFTGRNYRAEKVTVNSGPQQSASDSSQQQ